MYVPSLMDRKFEEFDARNPVVYEMMRDLALHRVSRTNRRCSGQALTEVLRWNVELEIEDTDIYRFNNDYVSYYTRKLAILEPELRDAFEMRPSQADPWANDFAARMGLVSG
jgi:hypothetical protein